MPHFDFDMRISVGHIIVIVSVIASIAIGWGAITRDVEINTASIKAVADDLKVEQDHIQRNHEQFITRREYEQSLRYISQQLEEIKAELIRQR